MAWLELVGCRVICGSSISSGNQTVFFAIGVAIIQWIAKMFGGKGTFDQLAYTFAAISVPYSLISAVFILLSAIPFVGFCFRMILDLRDFILLSLKSWQSKASINLAGERLIGVAVYPRLGEYS